MARKENQKLKLLVLKDILETQTDEQHALSLAELIDLLQAQGISAERKSLYDDLRVLSEYGLDIIRTKGQKTTYYLGSRAFQQTEVKLLVDAVQSCRFLTEDKSRALIAKLQTLTGVQAAQDLKKQVYMARRIKTHNEQIYYAVDAINTAVLQKKRITFQYCSWTADKKLTARRNGALYSASPYALIWDNENYYMVAYDEAAACERHYRVDKMQRIAVTAQPQAGEEYMRRFNWANYANEHFGMYGGAPRALRLRVKNASANVVIDRFGTQYAFTGQTADSFEVGVTAVPGPQFFGWVFGLEGAVEIVAPAEVREAYLRQCRAAVQAAE